MTMKMVVRWQEPPQTCFTGSMDSDFAFGEIFSCQNHVKSAIFGQNLLIWAEGFFEK